MKVGLAEFGAVEIDGQVYNKDLVIDRGEIKKRKKKRSKQFKGKFGHTPLSTEENIPWKCKKLVIGCGFNEALPVMDGVYSTARAKGVKLILLNTEQALTHLNDRNTNLILHLTC